MFASNSYRTRVGGFGRVGDLPAVRSFGVHQDGCQSTGLEQTKYEPWGEVLQGPLQLLKRTALLSPQRHAESNPLTCHLSVTMILTCVCHGHERGDLLCCLTTIFEG